MEWLTHAEFLDVLESQGQLLGEPHELHLGIDTTLFRDSEPFKPHVTDYEESYPAPLHRWYARIDDRYLTLDLTPDAVGRSCCTITTRLPVDDFTWRTLIALSPFPNTIDLYDVWHIETRPDAAQTHVVIRDDPRGFDYPIYHASSKQDADSLLTYLRDSAIVNYSIQLPDEEGSWQVWEERNAKRVCVGNYPFRAGTVAYACDLSQDGTKTIRVSSSSGPDNREYMIQNGLVISVTERAEPDDARESPS